MWDKEVMPKAVMVSLSPGLGNGTEVTCVTSWLGQICWWVVED